MIDSISHVFCDLPLMQMVSMARPGLSSISLIFLRFLIAQLLIFSFVTVELYNTTDV